jgi:hypothetical protein
MTYQFIRTYELLVVSDTGISSITENRLSFNITKTETGNDPNSANLSLYNLSRDTIRKFEAKNVSIILRCGYNPINQSPPTDIIFKGDVIDFSSYKQGEDFITRVECGDAAKTTKESQVNKSFSEESKTKRDVLKFLVDALKLPIDKESINLVPDSKKNISSNLVLSGRAIDSIDSIIKSEGLSWTIQNNKFIVYDSKKKQDESKSVYFINTDTGLISLKRKIESNIDFTSLIIPTIEPAKLVRIRSEVNNIDNFYRINRVDFDGDTFEGEWVMRCEAKLNGAE